MVNAESSPRPIVDDPQGLPISGGQLEGVGVVDGDLISGDVVIANLDHRTGEDVVAEDADDRRVQRLEKAAKLTEVERREDRPVDAQLPQLESLGAAQGHRQIALRGQRHEAGQIEPVGNPDIDDRLLGTRIEGEPADLLAVERRLDECDATHILADGGGRGRRPDAGPPNRSTRQLPSSNSTGLVESLNALPASSTRRQALDTAEISETG